MIDLTEDSVGSDIVVRHAADTEVVVRAGDAGGPALAGVVEGAVWARAEPGGPGIDLGHGALNLLVRSGTVLLDAQAGSGLMIVLRGEVAISAGGEPARVAKAGEAITFDATGRLSESDPVDAAELARDEFVSLNLVLDALEGVPVRLGDEDGEDGDPAPAPVARRDEIAERDMFPERRRGFFSRAKDLRG